MWAPTARGWAGFGVGPPRRQGWGCTAPRRPWETIRRWHECFGQAGYALAVTTGTCPSPDMPMSQAAGSRVNLPVSELSSTAWLCQAAGRDILKARVSRLQHRPLPIPGPTIPFL